MLHEGPEAFVPCSLVSFLVLTCEQVVQVGGICPTQLAFDFSSQRIRLGLQFFRGLLPHLLEYPVSSLDELAECWADPGPDLLYACCLVWDEILDSFHQ